MAISHTGKPVQPKTTGTTTTTTTQYKHRAALFVYSGDNQFIGIFNEAAQHTDEAVALEQEKFLYEAFQNLTIEQALSLVFMKNDKGNFELQHNGHTKGFINVASMTNGEIDLSDWNAADVEFRLRTPTAKSAQDKVAWLMS